jgi:hypothetical protein
MCTKFGRNRSSVPELCPNIQTHTHTHTYTYIHFYIYRYINKILIHTYRHMLPSLVEIAPGVPELRLSGVIFHQIPHWPETQKFTYFTVMWHHTSSGRLTYLDTNGRMFVRMFQHNTHYRAVVLSMGSTPQGLPIAAAVTCVCLIEDWDKYPGNAGYIS